MPEAGCSFALVMCPPELLHEGTNSSKLLCLMFVYFLFNVGVSELIFCFFDNLWFDDLREE